MRRRKEESRRPFVQHSTGNRDLFAELCEGFAALAAAREGKRMLPQHQVHSKPPNE